MCTLVTGFAYTERFTISEKDALMSREMNIPLLLFIFVGDKMVGGAAQVWVIVAAVARERSVGGFCRKLYGEKNPLTRKLHVMTNSLTVTR